MRNSLGQKHSEDNQIEAEELAAKAAQGDAAAFETLYKQYNGFVQNTAFHVLQSREDAEDISQQVWGKLYLKLQHYNPTDKFTTWLYRVTTNAAIDYLRRVRRSREVSLEEIDEKDAQQVTEPHGFAYIQFQSQEIDFVVTCIHEEFKRALENLSQKNETRARCLQLYYFYGKSVKEIAHEVNISIVNVKAHLYVARKYIENKHPDLFSLYKELVKVLGKTLC